MFYLHTGSLTVETQLLSQGCQAQLQVQLKSSLYYPYIPPLLTIRSAALKIGGISHELSAAQRAVWEAEVNVRAVEGAAEHPLPAQLAHVRECATAAMQAFAAGTTSYFQML